MPRPQQRYRFSIATLLLLLALFAVSIGWWIDSNRKPETLFLHIILPTLYTDPIQTPERLLTIELQPNREFGAEYSKYRQRTSGIVTSNESRNYHANIEGFFLSTGFWFDDKIELEKLYDANPGSFSGAIYTYRFVVSRNPEVKTFLEDQNAIDQRITGVNSPVEIAK